MLHWTLVLSIKKGRVDNISRVKPIKIRMAAQSRIQVTLLNIVRVAEEHLAFPRPMPAGHEVAVMEALCRHFDNSMKLALGDRL